MAIQFNIWGVVSCLFLLYMANSLYHLYHMYFPPLCTHSIDKDKCLDPSLNPESSHVDLKLYFTVTGHSHLIDFSKPFFEKNRFYLSTDFEETIEVEVPKRSLTNGTLWLHAFLCPGGAQGIIYCVYLLYICLFSYLFFYSFYML